MPCSAFLDFLPIISLSDVHTSKNMIIAEGSNNLLLPLLCAQSLIGSSYNLSPLLLRAQSLIMVFLSFFFMRLDACVFSVWRMMNMMSMMN